MIDVAHDGIYGDLIPALAGDRRERGPQGIKTDPLTISSAACADVPPSSGTILPK
jgi:hypothetical protein